MSDKFNEETTTTTTTTKRKKPLPIVIPTENSVKKILNENKIDLIKYNPDFDKYIDLFKDPSKYKTIASLYGTIKEIVIIEILENKLNLVYVKFKYINDIINHINLIKVYNKYNDKYKFNFLIPKIYYVEDTNNECIYVMEYIDFNWFETLKINPKWTPLPIQRSFGQIYALYYIEYNKILCDYEFYLNKQNEIYYITDFGCTNNFQKFQIKNKISKNELDGISDVVNEMITDIDKRDAFLNIFEINDDIPSTDTKIKYSKSGGNINKYKCTKYLSKCLSTNKNDPKYKLYYNKLIKYLQ